MKRTHVRSRSLASVGYDSRLRILEIEFRSGEVYRYDGVPACVYDELMNAPSRGAYFVEHIRDRFPYRRLSRPDD